MATTRGDSSPVVDGLKAVLRGVALLLAPALLVLCATLALRASPLDRPASPAAVPEAVDVAAATPCATSLRGEPPVEQTFGEVAEAEAEHEGGEGWPPSRYAPARTPIGLAQTAEDEVPACLARLVALPIRGPPVA